MPPKKSSLKKGTKKANPAGPELSPAPSEPTESTNQEIEDGSPAWLQPARKLWQAVSDVYLIYVILRTSSGQPPRVIVRKVYESQTEAFKAFAREYVMWTEGNAESGLFPPSHSNEHLKESYLINQLGKSRAENEALYPKSPQKMPLPIHLGAKIEYSLVHRGDINLDDDNPSKRTCTIVCEEIAHEAA